MNDLELLGALFAQTVDRDSIKQSVELTKLVARVSNNLTGAQCGEQFEFYMKLSPHVDVFVNLSEDEAGKASG